MLGLAFIVRAFDIDKSNKDIIKTNAFRIHKYLYFAGTLIILASITAMETNIAHLFLFF